MIALLHPITPKYESRQKKKKKYRGVLILGVIWFNWCNRTEDTRTGSKRGGVVARRHMSAGTEAVNLQSNDHTPEAEVLATRPLLEFRGKSSSRPRGTTALRKLTPS